MRVILLTLCVWLVGAVTSLWAIQIANESTEVNYRFNSGFRTAAPVENTNSTFLGAGYDLSSIGWWNQPGDQGRVKHTTLLSPLFSANASHYPFAVGNTVNFISDSGVQTANTVEYRATAYSDLSITRYQRAFTTAENISIIRVLDISSLNYTGQPVLMVGSHGTSSGPLGAYTGTELATAAVSSATSWFSVRGNSYSSAYSFQLLESGDSGSPVLVTYKGQVTLLGTITGAGGSGTSLTPSTYTAVLNAMMAPSGYATRFTIYDVPADTANTANVWTGGAGQGSFSSASNWSAGIAPVDLPVVFDASNHGGQSTVDIASDESVRGILFRSSGAAGGFTFGGAGTLSVGTTGIRNEGSQTQIFNNNISLIGSQNWEAVGGDLQVNGGIYTGSNSLALGGFVVVVQGQGNTTISGNITGAGGVAKDESGVLTLGGSNTYTDQTFLHNGTIRLVSDQALSAGSSVVFDTANAGVTLDVNGRNATAGDLKSNRDGTGRVTLGGGSLSVGSLNATSTYAGRFEGPGTVTKVGTGFWNLTGDNSTYTGSLVVSGGYLQVGASHALGGGENIVQGTGRIQTTASMDVYGRIKFTGTQTSASAITVGMGGNALAAQGDSAVVTYHDNVTLDRQGSGTGDVKYTFRTAGTGTQRLVFAGDIVSSGTTAGAVGLETWTQGATQNVIELQGRVSDGVEGVRLKLNVTGIGTTKLTHAAGNAYTGATTVYGGSSLIVNNTSGSGTGTGAVDVRATATLGGTGIIAAGGANGISVASGAVVAPGDGGIGTLSIDFASTTGQAVFQSGALFAFDLDSPGASDRMAFSSLFVGDVKFNGNQINFTNLGGLSAGTYTLFTFDTAGAYSGTLAIGTGLEAFADSSLIYNANSIQLNVVPEPAGIWLLFVALALLGLRADRLLGSNAGKACHFHKGCQQNTTASS